MRRRFAFFALAALALACFVSSPATTFAQHGGHGGGHFGGAHFGGGGFGGHYGGFGGHYGGYRGFGGYGGYGGWGYGGWGGYPGWGYGGYYGGYSPYYYSTPYYGYTAPYYDYYSPIYYGYADAAPVTGNVVASQSLYPPSGVTPASTEAPTDQEHAYIHVRVPVNAKVEFNNTPTRQQGTDRTFVTPDLNPNQAYTYDVSAQWMDNGQERRASRTVRVVPGHNYNVDFVNAPRDESQRR